MNIKEFYEADERRQSSPEFSYGLQWRTSADPDHAYDVFWVANTGELYTMRKNAPAHWPSLINHGDAVAIKDELQEYEAGVKELLSEILHPLHRRSKAPRPLPTSQAEQKSNSVDDEDDTSVDDSVGSLQVEVLDIIEGRERLDRIIEGWEQAIAQPDGLDWLRARVASMR